MSSLWEYVLFQLQDELINQIVNKNSGGKNPFAARKQEINTEKDAADNEFEDKPRPTSNNLKDHWPKIIYCILFYF